MAVCKGCGALLQYTDPHQPGYTPRKDSEYCQRCYRLMHYDDLTFSMKKGIDPDAVLDQIAGMDALVLWVVDLFDFEAGMIDGLNRKLADKDILIVCTKRDILPQTLSHEKIARFVFSRLKEQGIRVRGLIVTGKLKSDGTEEIRDAVAMLGHGRPVVVMGRANAGKSTLLNHLMGKNTLTMSRYPGTTLGFHEMQIDGVTYMDTPGLEIEHSILMNVKEEDLKEILPSRTIKPAVYQVHGDQSFAVGGLARVDVYGADDAAVTWYLGERLRLHRGKASNADALWEKHYGELFRPVPLENKFRTYQVRKTMSKEDAVVDGLGWACISGQVDRIVVKAPEHVGVTFRKAML